MEGKINYKQKYLMRLIHEGQTADGWTTVSKQLWPLFIQILPRQLVEMRETEDGGIARLTYDGRVILEWT